MKIRRLLVLLFALAACGGPQAPARGPSSGGEASADAQPEPLQVEGGPLTIGIFRSAERTASVNSYLLMGAEEAILVDAQLVDSEARRLVDWVRGTGKRLTTVYVTHGHPDHFMGLRVVAEAFPEARILARPRVAENMPVLFERYRAPLNRFFPGDVADGVVTPERFEGDTLELDGTEIRILELEEGEADLLTMLHIPSMRALFCADVVYHDVHPWLNELRVDGVLEHVERVRAMELDWIYPGHGDPVRPEYLDTYVEYVRTFVSMAQTAESAPALIEAMLQRYPSWRTEAGLRFSAQAHLEARRAAGR